MAVLRLDRFTIDPADGEELLSRHAALVAAVKDAFPGLLGVELAKVGSPDPRRQAGITPAPAYQRRKPGQALAARRERERA